LPKDSEDSAPGSSPASGTAPGTPPPNGAPPNETLKTGKTRAAFARHSQNAIDWRYLNHEDWPIVALALNYYLSTFVSADSRAPIERVREELARQEPTV
jgi:hypothetical protein